MSLSVYQRCAIVLLVAATFITTFKSVFSQEGGEADAKPPQFPTEVSLIQSVIVDKDGMPISGAKADVYAMRCIEEKGNHYGWRSDNISPELRKSTSNDDGAIEFRYPFQFGSPQNWLNTCQISVSIRHPLFVPHIIHLDLAQEPKSIALKSGCKLSITASDQSGRPIDQFYPYIPGEAGSVHWKQNAGVLTTGGLPVGKLLYLLASPNKDGTLFSQLLEIETTLDQTVLQERIPLKRGKRLFGNLPAEVPRPIVDGQVSNHALLESDATLKGRI